jgi:hypothetical protein
MLEARRNRDKEQDKGQQAAAPADAMGEKKEDARAAGLGTRLVPFGDPDKPVVAIYSALIPAKGMAVIDFGFLEPAMLAEQGGKLAESVNRRQAVRVTMGYEALQNLQQQINRLAQVARARSAKTSPKA